MTKTPLTKQQGKVLAFVREFIRDRGYPPTRKEIADGFGWYPSAAQSHLVLIQKKGYIKLDSRAGQRNIVVL